MTRYLAVVLATLLGACASRLPPPEPEPLPAETPGGAPVGVIVRGVVTDRWGYRVPDAWITVRVGSPHASGPGDRDCEGATHLPTRTRSSPLGEFAVLVDAGSRPPFRACLEVEALPPRGYGMREATLVVPDAAFATGPHQSANAHDVHLVVY